MNETLPTLPQRTPTGHKGTFGAVTVFGGSASDGSMMIGAPALAATAALRSGAGLAKIAATRRVLDAALATCPSATGLEIEATAAGEMSAQSAIQILDASGDASDALVIGPGLGLSDAASALVLRAMQQEDAPAVLDADALTLLSRMPEPTRDLRAPCVLTPHPGEFARLASALSIAGDPSSPDDRPRLTEELAQRLGAVVVLKGARTVASDGHRSWTCERIEPVLATGGTGDVLAGAIAGIIAQHVRIAAHPLMRDPTSIDLYEAACAGVEAHARAAASWAREQHATGGMLAMELASLLPEAVESLRASEPGRNP